MAELFIRKPRAIAADKRLTATEADYLCLIAQLHNANGCTASNQYFAEFFGMDRRNAVRIISSLKQKGFIETREKRSGGKTEVRTITIIDSDSAKYLLADSVKTTPLDSVELTPSDSVKMTPLIVSNLSPIHESIHENIRKRAQSRAHASLFDSFWRAYPRRKAKASAEKAFTKLNPDEELLNKMLKAIESQKQCDDWRKNGGQFIPYPATWLNQRRWEDEIEAELATVDVDKFGCSDKRTKDDARKTSRAAKTPTAKETEDHEARYITDPETVERIHREVGLC